MPRLDFAEVGLDASAETRSPNKLHRLHYSTLNPAVSKHALSTSRRYPQVSLMDSVKSFEHTSRHSSQSSCHALSLEFVHSEHALRKDEQERWRQAKEKSWIENVG